MYELRFYATISDMRKRTNNYEVVDRYPNPSLAYGMRKKKAKEPNYRETLLKVVKV